VFLKDLICLTWVGWCLFHIIKYSFKTTLLRSIIKLKSLLLKVCTMEVGLAFQKKTINAEKMSY